MTKRHYLSFLSAAFLIMATYISGNAVGFFIKPITAELGFTRSAFSIYLSLSTLTGVFVLPFIGQFLPKFGAKKLLIVGGTWVSLGFVWLAFATQLWQFYAGGIFLGLFMMPITMFLAILLINNWFESKKGLMMGLLNASGGLAGAVVAIYMPMFLDNFGWRNGYLLIAGLFALLTIPNALFLLVEHPESIGLRAYGNNTVAYEDGLGSTPEQSISYTEAKKTKQFYILFAGIFLSAFGGGLMQHLPALFSGIGFTAGEVGTLFSLVMAGMIIANILVGAVNDKIDSTITILVVSVCMIVSLFLLATTSSFLSLAILMFVLAFGIGGPSVLTPLVVNEVFGPRDYFRIWSILGMAPSIGMSISGPLWGAVYDVTGSYQLGMYAMISLTVIYGACYIFALKSGPLKKNREESGM
jgi:MFS family permease